MDDEQPDTLLQKLAARPSAHGPVSIIALGKLVSTMAQVTREAIDASAATAMERITALEACCAGLRSSLDKAAQSNSSMRRQIAALERKVNGS